MSSKGLRFSGRFCSTERLWWQTAVAVLIALIVLHPFGSHYEKPSGSILGSENELQYLRLGSLPTSRFVPD